MVFVAPRLTAEQGMQIIGGVWMASRGKKKRFLKIMSFLMDNHCFQLAHRQSRINFSNTFNEDLDDSTARVLYNFTIPQLQTLSVKLRLPAPHIRTTEGGVVPTVEALAMVCRRLSEPSKFFTVANEFGRSTGAYSRVCTHTIAILYKQHKHILYFNHPIVATRTTAYCAAVARKGAPLRSCWAFIDGTKQYISRPSARKHPSSPFENLQRAIYTGHPRRPCFNWQGVTTPDGIIVSMYGPVESRRHDTTMLSMSSLLDVFANDADALFHNKVIYGDPAYGCSEFVCCPFPDYHNNPNKAIFNSRMSSVREAVEWGFA